MILHPSSKILILLFKIFFGWIACILPLKFVGDVLRTGTLAFLPFFLVLPFYFGIEPPKFASLLQLYCFSSLLVCKAWNPSTTTKKNRSKGSVVCVVDDFCFYYFFSCLTTRSLGARKCWIVPWRSPKPKRRAGHAQVEGGKEQHTQVEGD
jgi:hypothetical protein